MAEKIHYLYNWRKKKTFGKRNKRKRIRIIKRKRRRTRKKVKLYVKVKGKEKEKKTIEKEKGKKKKNANKAGYIWRENRGEPIFPRSSLRDGLWKTNGWM